MKYRIKIVTYKNGSQLFYAMVRKWFIWVGIGYDGDTTSLYYPDDNTRDEALKRIDKHHAGNRKVKTIDFEYINKED